MSINSNYFSLLSKLPPYVFSVVNDLKYRARRNGEDIIDFGMGNPDGATPDFIVEKLKEVVMRPDTHRYSQSKGIPKLRQAITDWYARKFDVALDPEEEAIATLGSKEGLSHLAIATMDKGDVILVPNPAYPIHPFGFVIAGADIHHVPIGPGIDFFKSLKDAIKNFPNYENEIKQYYPNHRNMVNGVYQDTIDIFRKIKSSGYPCYVLSNWSDETYEGMEDQHPFLKEFDDKIISGREFLVKPDPEIYKLAISRFNLTPEQTLFIDDRIENIEAAQSLGFQTIHLTDPLTIKSQIANHIIV